MRRFFIVTAIFVFLLAFSTSAFAQHTIAVFSSVEVIRDCKLTAAENAYIENKYKAERDAVLKLENELRQQMEQLRMQAGGLTRDAQEDRQLALQQLNAQYQTERRRLEEKLGQENSRVQVRIFDLLTRASKSYAEKNNIDIMLDMSLGVLYVTPTADITKALLTEVDAIFQAEGAKAGITAPDSAAGYR